MSPGGGLSYQRDGDARRLAWGVNWILVSLKVFWANAIIFSREDLV